MLLTALHNSARQTSQQIGQSSKFKAHASYYYACAYNTGALAAQKCIQENGGLLNPTQATH